MAASRPNDWHCPDCRTLVFGSKKECWRCGKYRPLPGPLKRPGDWNCPHCDKLVFASKSKCGFCNKGVRPASAKPVDDWTCKKCGFEGNFKRRPTCFKCNTAKDWEPSTDSAVGTCSVCMDAPVETLLKGCGHAALCKACVSAVQGSCPICRASFSASDVAPMYLS